MSGTSLVNVIEQLLMAQTLAFRGALKIAELDLAAAREHVEQFKAISEASEQALREHLETWDNYKEEQEALVARKDVGFCNIYPSGVLTACYRLTSTDWRSVCEACWTTLQKHLQSAINYSVTWRLNEYLPNLRSASWRVLLLI